MITDWYTLIGLVIILLNIVVSSVRGFSREFLSLCGVVVGVILGLRWGAQVAGFLLPVSNGLLLLIAGFLLFFLPSVFVFSWIGIRFRTLFKTLGVTWVDSLLGIPVGIVKGVLWVIVITVLIANFQFLDFLDRGVKRSFLYKEITKPSLIYLYSWTAQIPNTELLQDIFQKGLEEDESTFSRDLEEF